MGRSVTAEAAPPAHRVAVPRWTDRRLVVGILLAVASLVGVVWVVHASNHTVEAWVYRSDLAPGSQVSAADVSQVAVKLPEVSAYLPPTTSPVGKLTSRSVRAGELVSVSSLQDADSAVKLRLVTLPVERHHLPLDVQRGESVDVYVTERGASGEPLAAPKLVLPAATVAGVDDGDSRFGGSSLELGVALSVDASDVAKLVAAEASGTITLVRVPEEPT